MVGREHLEHSGPTGNGLCTFREPLLVIEQRGSDIKMGGEVPGE